MDIGLTWVHTRPTPEVHRNISFSGNDADILTEAARVFRSRHPRPDQFLLGTVHTLKRLDEDVEGLVTLKAFVDEGAIRSCRAESGKLFGRGPCARQQDADPGKRRSRERGPALAVDQRESHCFIQQ